MLLEKTTNLKEPRELGLLSHSLALELPLDLESQLFGRQKEQLFGRAKRQLDYDSGRFCAARCLSKLGLMTQVASGPDRSPIWPQGSVGSISHSDNFAWSVVARTVEYRSLGVDTEPIADALTLQHLYDEIILPGEDRVALETGISKRQAFTLIFSSKESLYKCIYPIDRHFFGFEMARVTRIEANSLWLKLDTKHPNKQFAGRDFELGYQIDESDVFTACYLRQEASEIR